MSPKLRPKGTNLLQALDGGSKLSTEERIYKMIMEIGTDDVKESYKPILAELMIEVSDIIDR